MSSLYTQSSAHEQQPAASNIQPWNSFPKMRYSFINDDFLHSPIALKVNLRVPKGEVSINQTITQTKSGIHWHEQTKFRFTVNQSRSIQAKIRTGDILKLHYDNGTSTLFQKPVNLYAGVSFRRQLKHFNWRFGLTHNQNGLNIDNRIRIDSAEKTNVSFSTRSLYTKNNFTFGLTASYDFMKHLLTKNSLLLAYNLNQNSSLFFRSQNQHVSHTNPSSFINWFGVFSFDAVVKYNQSTKLGIQLSLQPRKHPLKEVILVVQRKFDEELIGKVKINLSRQLQLNSLLKLPILFNKQIGNLSFGLHGSNLLNSHREYNFRSQIQFNF